MRLGLWVFRRRPSPAVVASLAALPFSALADGTATLNVRTEAFGLDDGAIHAVDVISAADSAELPDSRLSYHANRVPHSVLVPAGEGIEMAAVSDTGFDTIMSTEAESATFSLQARNIPFSANHCILVRTDQGAAFQLCKVIEDGLTIIFDCTAL